VYVRVSNSSYIYRGVREDVFEGRRNDRAVFATIKPNGRTRQSTASIVYTYVRSNTYSTFAGLVETAKSGLFEYKCNFKKS